jgi:hypothetical protein
MADLKYIKGANLDEMLQSIDGLIGSLSVRRYNQDSSTVQSSEATQLPKLPISVYVPAGKSGGKVIAIPGIITSVCCFNPALTKNNAVEITVMTGIQQNKTSMKITDSSGQQTANIAVPKGSEIDIAINPPLAADIYVGFVFQPSKGEVK